MVPDIAMEMRDANHDKPTDSVRYHMCQVAGRVANRATCPVLREKIANILLLRIRFVGALAPEAAKFAPLCHAAPKGVGKSMQCCSDTFHTDNTQQ